ncbi:MAG: hypothetical protein K2H26_02445, partial [Ruminococcus sp.]|nr:hypothetical protein [Ruminococcus sp.]
AEKNITDAKISVIPYFSGINDLQKTILGNLGANPVLLMRGADRFVLMLPTDNKLYIRIDACCNGN